ncbi:Eco57I restriction-modification methylase domain-containing protein [Nannocystaceae bacterium ST9]
MNTIEIPWWSSLFQGGLLIGSARVLEFFAEPLPELAAHDAAALRRQVHMMLGGSGQIGQFLDTVFERVLGLERASWLRGSDIDAKWAHRSLAGDMLKPRRAWLGPRGEIYPIFVVDVARGKRAARLGRRAVAEVIEWLRLAGIEVAIVTNGRQLRLVHAGADYDAFCEWDIERWFEQGVPGLQVEALRRLLGRGAWTIRDTGEERSPLVRAILASRKGQTELSAVLGERIRQAVETLIQASAPLLEGLVGEQPGQVAASDAYIAATRMIMRIVVIAFAEARSLMPIGDPLYHESYGLQGLRAELERAAGGHGERLRYRYAAWPRLLGLFRLVYEGSGHEELIVTRYGGGLFRAGRVDGDGIERALHALESNRGHVSDDVVHRILELITRSKVRVRQGRSSVWVDESVDFSNLSSEYIGILYEGLLDYELRRAKSDDPMVFLDIGNHPVLAFSRLDAMTGKERKGLLDKLAKASKSKDEGEAAPEAEEEVEPEAEAEVDDESPDEDEVLPEPDEAATLDDATRVWREKVETWAKLAVRDAGWTKRGASLDDPEVARKAQQLIRRVVLPGEWFLVRWGGTRKGGGTFYTPPQLAGPTVRRTLQPLTHTPVRESTDPETGLVDVLEWRPRLPEQILALKVCEPAMGSGSFLVAAVHWLTDAVYESLVVHGRIAKHNGGAIVRMADGLADDRFSVESLPLPPEHEEFEPTLRARLKRYVVERCIHGVDLNPVAVELARSALWVDTMDVNLPFEFLDHKLRCGNALVGCWYDYVERYPIKAWEREGGDKGHGNFVHHFREVVAKGKAKPERRGDKWTQAIKTRKAVIKAALADQTHASKQQAFEYRNDDAAPNRALQTARGLFERIHQDLELETNFEHKAELYAQVRHELAPLREAFDAWCALWFWPGDAIDDAPTPQELANPSPSAQALIARIRAEHRFFHWELEFPDVFTRPGAGFDAVIGNPPWDIQKPNSKEFFSNVEPLYRTFGKQEALKWQERAFAGSPELEREWIAYQSRFKSLSNWVRWVAGPFDDGEGVAVREGFADPEHPFRYQGSADLNSYKLFVEVFHALLRDGGRMGFIVPSGLYTDLGSTMLRELLLQRYRWEWLFGFENREGIFGIEGRFRFAVFIVAREESSGDIRAAFMRSSVFDWSVERPRVFQYPSDLVARFSPKSKSVVELAEVRDLVVLRKMYMEGTSLGAAGWNVKYAREMDMTNDSDIYRARDEWEMEGFRCDMYGHWLSGPWRSGDGCICKDRMVSSADGRAFIKIDDVSGVALPLYQGVMVNQFDFCASGFVRGTGWRSRSLEGERFAAKYLVSLKDCRGRGIGSDVKFAFRDISNATNSRTMIGVLISRFPCGNTLGSLSCPDGDVVSLASAANSLPVDWAVRRRLGGFHINLHVIEELPFPLPVRCLGGPLAMSLSCADVSFASMWSGCAMGRDKPWRRCWAVTVYERMRLRVVLDAIAAEAFRMSPDDYKWILRGSDLPVRMISSVRHDPKGFWRVDKTKPPELRHTVLSLVAFHDLQRMGLEQFLAQNDGEGWMLPETLRLADYGLGHDDRAKQHQPVASVLGPRFLDWQLAQGVEESWEECERHAELIDQILPLPKPDTPISPPHGQADLPIGEPPPTPDKPKRKSKSK